MSLVPLCPQSWCRWLLVDSAAFAARPVPRQLPEALPRRPLPPLPAPLALDAENCEVDAHSEPVDDELPLR